jgi:lipid-binding SYLF domain-containing protein
MNSKRVSVLVAAAVLLTSCAGAGWRPAEPKDDQQRRAFDEVVETVERFEARDPSIRYALSQAHAFAVFPSVGKGALWVGAAHGDGHVFRGAELIGSSTLTQVTAGAQIGGQAYSEIIFFRDAAALRDFTQGNYELGAQASAVAVTAGAAANASYDEGVAIFTLPKAGLMFEASVAGQKFTFEPVPPSDS